MGGVGIVQMCLGHYEEALNWAERSLAMNPNWHSNHWILISANAQLGRLERAKQALSAFQALEPGVTLARVRIGFHSKDPSRGEAFFEGMRLAGMPEV